MNEMDLIGNNRLHQFGIACLMLASLGCVAPQTPVPTIWQKLGLPQAGARFRDGLINRRGNFPGLEKKPPVLALADPANLEPGKPDMIKAAAEIKQDQDLKKQKIKAIKFLAEVNCGCYNKDDKVEAAFLAALEDCDPDVRAAGVEGLNKTAGSDCARCNNHCLTTCCTKKIYEKLQDLATGMEDGCFKEPVKEIRDAAKAVYCKCPPPLEEPIEPEELIPPEPLPADDGTDPKIREGEDGPEVIEGKQVSFRLSDSKNSSRRARFLLANSASNGVGEIENPEEMVDARTVYYRKTLGELLVHLPDVYAIKPGWKAVVLDNTGEYSLAEITEIGGRRILLAIENPADVEISAGSAVRIGLVAN